MATTNVISNASPEASTPLTSPRTEGQDIPLPEDEDYLELLGQKLDAFKEKLAATKCEDEPDIEALNAEWAAIQSEIDANRERERINYERERITAIQQGRAPYRRITVADDSRRRRDALKAFFGEVPKDKEEMLEPIAFLIDRNRDFITNTLYFDPKWIEGYVDGNDDDDFDDDDLIYDRSHWYDYFLVAFNWWVSVSDTLLEGGDDAYLRGPDPSLADHRKQISVLVSDVLAAYLPAMQSAPCYTDDWDGEQAIESAKKLLKAYWRFRCYVCDFAREVAPDVNLKALLEIA